MTTFEEMRQRGLFCMRREDFTAAAEWFAAASVVAPTRGHASLAAIHLASVAVFREELDSLITELPRAVLRRESDLQVFLAAYYYAVHLISSGECAAASRYVEIAKSSALRLGTPYYFATAHDLAATVLASSGHFADAVELSRDALASISFDTDDPATLQARGVIAHNLGYACLSTGRHSEAIRHLRLGIEDIKSADGFVGPEALLNLAFALCVTGDIDAAEESLDALQATMRTSDEWVLPYSHLLRGEIAQRRGDRANARAHFARVGDFYPSFPDVAVWLETVDLLPILLPEKPSGHDV